MRHLARQLDLPLEPGQDFGVPGQFRPDELERDVSFELLVVHPVDSPHASLPQELHHAVPVSDLMTLRKSLGAGDGLTGVRVVCAIEGR